MFYTFTFNKSKKIDHIALWTTDIELMKAFYCQNFDATAGEIYRNSKSGFCSYFIKLKTGTRIELMHNKQIAPDNRNWGHISIAVGSKKHVDCLTKQLSEKGIEVIGQPRITGDGYYESLIKDPEGNLIEITI